MGYTSAVLFNLWAGFVQRMSIRTAFLDQTQKFISSSNLLSLPTIATEVLQKTHKQSAKAVSLLHSLIPEASFRRHTVTDREGSIWTDEWLLALTETFPEQTCLTEFAEGFKDG